MRLFALMVAQEENEWLKPIAYSHDVEKLQTLAFTCTSWTVGATGSKVVRRSADDVYPLYTIQEVPFVC